MWLLGMQASALFSLLAFAQEPAPLESEPVEESHEKSAAIRPLTVAVARVVGAPSAITALDDVHLYPTPEVRLRAIQRLSDRLLVEDQRALLAFAKGPRPPEFKWPAWRAVVNDILDVLLAQSAVLNGFEAELFRLARSAEDPVLRDYAIQKLPRLVLRLSKPAVREEARQIVREFAAHSGASEQGTALLAWQRLNAAGGEPDPLLADAVRSCLEADSITSSAQVSALQIGASLRLPEAVFAARRFLESSESPVALKLSSLAALGRCGNLEDGPVLRRFLENPTFQVAARTALLSLRANP
jgi:hypothetical protein